MSLRPLDPNTPPLRHNSPPQDVARMTMAALRSPACVNRTLTLAGPKAYTTAEVIEMCEDMSDSKVGLDPGVAVEWVVGFVGLFHWVHFGKCAGSGA